MSGKFEPKVPVQLNPPKDDPISLEELAKANGKTLTINPAVEVLCFVFSGNGADNTLQLRC